MSGTEFNWWIISREIFGKELIARIFLLDEGVYVLVYGGEWSHIGAVTVISPGEEMNTIQFPGHKDAVISEAWAKRFHQEFEVPVMCGAGIHYDNLRLCEILEVVKMTKDMMAEGIALLKEKTAMQPKPEEVR